jgi:rhodanese-related sulfurtransferase
MLRIISSLVFYQNKKENPALTHLSSEAFEQKIQQGTGILLDVRTMPEYRQAHIQGSQLMDFYDAGFAEQLLQIDPDETILLYCRTGHRSRIAGEFLVKNGYHKVINLQHGIVEWYAKGLPLQFDSQ